MVRSFAKGVVTLENVLSGAVDRRRFAALLSVTARLPVELLYQELVKRETEWGSAGIASVNRVGDCLAPSTIQAAVYAGHKLARSLDEAPEGDVPRELPAI